MMKDQTEELPPGQDPNAKQSTTLCKCCSLK